MRLHDKMWKSLNEDLAHTGIWGKLWRVVLVNVHGKVSSQAREFLVVIREDGMEDALRAVVELNE